MKKMFLALIAIGVLATSANAWWIPGVKVKWIEVQSGGYTYIAMDKGSDFYNYRLGGNSEVVKTMIASAMTASASGQYISVEINGGLITNLYLYGAGVTP